MQVASSNWRRVLSYINAHRTEEEIEQFIIVDGKSMDKTPGRYVAYVKLLVDCKLLANRKLLADDEHLVDTNI